METFLGTVERNSHNYDTEYGYDEAQEMFWKGYYEGPGKEASEALDFFVILVLRACSTSIACLSFASV